jgi:hypothetical protein
LLVAHGISRLLVGSSFDGGEKLGKFVAGSQGGILEIFPGGRFGIAETARELGERKGRYPLIFLVTSEF